MLALLLAPPAPAGEPASGLLFRLEKPGVEPSYLFGTIHSEDPRVTRLPVAVARAFDAAPLLVAETIVDAENAKRAMEMLRLPDGAQLRSLIGPRLYSRVVRALAQMGIAESSIRSYKPWAVVTLLSVPPARSGRFLDLVLHQEALAQGKDVRGLESVDEQLAIFDELSLVEQVALLEHALDQQDRLSVVHEQLIQAYLREDLAALSRISSEIMGDAGSALADKVMRGLIDDRNRTLIHRMRSYLDSGGAFIAVGALHLPGPNGMLRQLAEEGFTVVQVD
jgi:uncharacterized protein YbaP (TraB family)